MYLYNAKDLPMLRCLITSGLLLVAHAPAFAQRMPDSSVQAGVPAIDPTQWRSEIAGPPTQVLTIGSAHLSQLPPGATHAMLEPLIGRLIAFAPDIVTHEGVSGEQCEMLRATPELFDGAAEAYCWDPSPVTAITGIAGPAARIRIAETLASWPAAPTAAQRRGLAMLFLSANDRPSALVQWLQLPETERRAGDGLTAELVAILTTVQARMNETYAVAAVVAARLGHARIYAVDDHSSDAVMDIAPAQCVAAITAMWQSPAGAALRTREEPLVRGLNSAEAMLGYYRYMNQPETLRSYLDVDQRAAVGGGGAGDCGRRYLAWWETRNLRMVGHIRAAMGSRPGARVLNIVGASHKPYYDLYLSQMADAVIVDAGAILGQD